MRTRSRNPFSTVKTAGLLLPVDLLTRIVEGDGGLPGLSPDDYHLPPGERLNEAASQAWNRCLAAWRHFRREADKLPATDAGTTLTRQRWLLPLFQELGYGRLQATSGVQIEGKAYPISHAWGEHVPIHLISFRHETDKRTPGVSGAATRSPYSMVQELLNRSAAYRWGFLSNGRKLIVLRDNAALVRAANVEFDLEAMMEGEVYADFTLLFLICHQSRVEVPPDAGPEDCWLEKWSNLADEQGTRAREHLRDGVEAAINALGAGFLTTKGNTQLRERLRSGDLSTQDYYRQLLRLVYRLLMLLVAEEKKDEHSNNLLHPPDTSPEIRERYARFYSVSRVRQLAAHRRGTPHTDLYESLKVLFLKFREGYAPLGIPGLGSFLFSAEATPDLDQAALANVGLLESMRKLTFTLDTSGRGGAVRRPVDFANLASEELGSVYESLLELHPRIDSDEGPFTLTTAAGHERKTTGSYYTPTSLINCLLDSALDPVVEDRLKEAERLASGEWRTDEEKCYAYSVVSGSGRVAARHESRRVGVPSDSQVSETGTLRDDESDSQISGLDTSEHRGGLGTAGQQGVSAVHQDRPGKPAGTGDASPAQPARGDLPEGRNQTTSGRSDDPQQTTGEPRSESAKLEALEERWNKTPLATRHSLLAEQALLALTICDPACGSGHFLIAAAERLAKHLARLRTGDEEPSVLDVQHAKRDIIGRCIYGVDINPMAVELCKVSLWMEALEPGRPLSFLDAHIQCGNSLLGATPRLLRDGIPDDAFKPIEGDDKKLCAEYKKQNRDERRGQKLLPFEGSGKPWERMGDLATALANLDDEGDDTVDAVRRKQERYAQLVTSAGYLSTRFWADAWCAAFVWKKTKEFDYAITEEVFRRIERNPHDCPPWMRDEVQRLARQYHFFHWHLAFPQVFRVPVADEDPENRQTDWSGGFDLVLGNPPWVRQELLKPIKQLLVSFSSFKSTADSSVYFLELALNAARTHGRVAMLTPNKWFRANYAEPLRAYLRGHARIQLLIDFGHSRTLFPDADTFPAAVTLEPTRMPVVDTSEASFVRAHDSDRNRHSLNALIRSCSVQVPHANLRPDRWQLESADASGLLDRLMGTGKQLATVLEQPIFRGLLSGFNTAFYVDSGTRDELVAGDPTCAPLVKKFLRGRDVKRWVPRWDGQWHIVIASSQNKTWPWSSCTSDAEAEDVFRNTYPSLHRHLKQYEQQLRNRQDKGTRWWELRACDYYDVFEEPKIVVQCIAYYSQFACDVDGHYVNNKAIVIPTDDLYLLAILNSRITWWIVNRTFQHMKDEGLSVDVQFLARLPIPKVNEDHHRKTADAARELVAMAGREDANLDELLSAELRLNDLVNDAFELTPNERRVLEDSLPPRDPIATLELQGARPPREVVTLTERQVEIARAMAYVVLLLRAWNRPVARAALEPALVLMLSDHARQQILGQAGQTAAKRTGAPSQGYVEGLDHLIGALESGGMVTIAERGGQQVLELGPRAGDIPDPPQPDRQRVEETMRAFETLGEDRARIQLSEVLDERFVLVQS